MGDDCFKCTMCFFRDSRYTAFSRHMVQMHKHDSHFIINCGFQSCPYVTKSWPSFKMHVKRKHQVCDESHCEYPDEMNIDDCLPPNINTQQTPLPSNRIMLSAAYLLQLESEHKLTRRALDSVVSTTSDLLTSHISIAKQEIQSNLSKNGFQFGHSVFDDVSVDCFGGLETHKKRVKFYKQNFGLVEPQEVCLGKMLTKRQGKIVPVKKCGIIVPFESSLKALLSLPEVWHYVQHPHISHTSVMRDVCDGSAWSENELFSRNPCALQIFLNTDDIEIVNPIGAHVKKHKLTMFYYTIGNVPPQFRSKLASVQLLAIAKNKDVRKFGVKHLLSDFLHTVTKLAHGGIVVEIHGSTHVIEGTLLLVCADTPAANWLGGFKEGVGFSRKGCRCCNASDVSMKSHFTANSFQERSLADHLTRCRELGNLSRAAFKYWSRQWGINNTSCLIDVPHFDLCASFVQDPMHLLLEGVIPYELKLLLHFFVFGEKMFTISWLNMQLESFPYSYLENDKPEPIMHNDLLAEKKLKQTSAAVLTMCKILPYIIGTKVPHDCAQWINFLRLVQITFLVTCPTATSETAGQISQLVTTHHLLFREHYPKATITPKMHYLVHLPKQLLKFGPLRHHWCLRFEAKHAFFKSFRMKCFKNLPKSLAQKHQFWMCYKQVGPMGTPSRNFLYDGDVVAEGENKLISDKYPSLAEQFLSYVNASGQHDSAVCFMDCVKIHGLQFKIGCVLVTQYDFSGQPNFCIVKDICVHSDEKLFVLEQLEVDHFKHEMLCYVVKPTADVSLVRYAALHYPWPLSVHRINGQMCVINVYGHIAEFLM